MKLTKDDRRKLWFIGWVDLIIILIALLILIFFNGDYTSQRYILTYIHFAHIIPAIFALFAVLFDRTEAIYGIVFVSGLLLFLIEIVVLIWRITLLVSAILPVDLLLVYFDVVFLITAAFYASTFAWKDDELENESNQLDNNNNNNAYGYGVIPQNLSLTGIKQRKF